MGILNVDTIKPVGGGTTITLSTSEINVGTGITFESNGQAIYSGIITATSFSGSGANLTGITGTTINNNADNRVITGSGTANTLEAESNLTFDGSDLTQTIGASNKGIKLTAAGSHYPSITFDANRSTENNAIMWLNGKWNGTDVGSISVEAGDDTTNKDDGKITFYTAQGGTSTRKMAIEQDGNVHIDNGNLVIGTAGKGFDFSAQTVGSVSGVTVTSEVLHHYEEGTFTPELLYVNVPTYNSRSGKYTRIGNIVYCQGKLDVASGLDTSDGSGFTIGGIPYANSNESVDGHESVLFTLGRYTSLLGGKSTSVRNVRFTTNGFQMLEGNDSKITYNECASSGKFNFSAMYMIQGT